MRRPRLSWPAARGDRIVLLALGGLLAAGAALRLVFVDAIVPASLGYPDSPIYLRAAQDHLFDDPGRPAGYPFLLRAAHALDPQLWLTILLQHALGLATAVLLFLIVRRVAPAAWGLLPAAVVLLAGPQVFLEHAVMSEGPFLFLVVAACYCAVRALDGRAMPWASLAAVLGVASALMRSIGLMLAAMMILWLVVLGPGRIRERLKVAVVATLCAWLVFAAYLVEARRVSGYVGPGLTRAGGLVLYSRVMSFADCTRFTPPKDTSGLCDRRPPGKRPGPNYYSMGVGSPPTIAFGRLDLLRPRDNARLFAFSRAAILHQPLDYLHDVGRDVSHLWASDDGDNQSTEYIFQPYEALVGSFTFYPDDWTVSVFRSWYGTGRPHYRQAPLRFLKSYEQHTRLDTAQLLLLIALALAGVPLARGRRLAVGGLMVGMSVALMVGPIAVGFYDARFAIPGYGLLAAAAAIGAASLWERVAGWRAAQRVRSVETARA